jgi:rfaE bifunctional protein kinase chain/domain/rfaE bifunctional protein nucleotidyltransferase chain/domain
MVRKIFSLNGLSKILEKKRRVKKIVLCHGVFDLVHIGHIEHFKKAKSLGDILVVTVTTDKYINKGPGRPYFNTQLRKEFLQSISCIDFVAEIDSPSVIEGIRIIKPDIYCKGNDYKDHSKDITNKIKKEIAEIRKYNGKIFYTDEITFSSSKLLNQNKIIHNDDYNKTINQITSKYSYRDIEIILDDLLETKALVIGEIILDQYNFCEPLGKSGKDPIMMFRNIHYEKYLGGTAAIANHLSSFLNYIKLVSTISDKNDNENFIKKNLKKNIKTHLIPKENSPTIKKEKYIDHITNNKIIGFYHFNDTQLNAKLEKKTIKIISEYVKNLDIVVLADYGHGMISNKIAKSICKKSNFLVVNAQINAANSSHHTLNKYNNLDAIIINESELRHELRDRSSSIELLVKIFIKNKDINYIVVTSGSKGARLFDNIKKKFYHVPSFTNNVVDKIGSGDAMMSLFSIILYKTKDPLLSIFLGSLAAAQAIQTLGNKKSIEKDLILKTLQHIFIKI